MVIRGMSCIVSNFYIKSQLFDPRMHYNEVV